MGQIQTCGKHFRRGKSTFLQRIYWHLCLNQLVYLRNNGVFSGNNGQWLIANWNVNTSFPYGSTDALTNLVIYQGIQLRLKGSSTNVDVHTTRILRVI